MRYERMSPSKLERYLNILEVLVFCPLEFERVSYKTSMERSILKQHLGFLVYHGLVEEQHFGEGRVAYAITEIGLTVLRTIQGQRHFEKIREIVAHQQ